MRRALCEVVAGGILAVVALGPGVRAETITGVKPAEPQPSAEQLTAGLAVEYTYARFNHLSEMEGRRFESGPPLPNLDYKVGSGKVLTSKVRDEVGAVITGFIRLDQPGLWGFNVTSNDGVRVEIGGQLIYEDPGVHSDDTSDRIDVKVETPGWYPIRVTYFEKRYTSTLQLRWIAPSQKGSLKAVPPQAFAHLKK